MPTAEIARALYGAYRLARFDAGGMAYFNATPVGFWRSFYAALFVAPLYLLVRATEYEAGLTVAPPLRLVLVSAVTYAIAWLAFPVAMVTVARMLDREERYIAYIVAYNWAAVWQSAAFLPVIILGTMGAMPLAVSQFLTIFVFLAVVVYSWFVSKTAMAVSGSTAAGLVVLGIVLDILIELVAAEMLHR